MAASTDEALDPLRVVIVGNVDHGKSTLIGRLLNEAGALPEDRLVAPGQDEFLRNMVTGAASADIAIVVIDAAEGALDQSRRHLYLLSLLGVRRLIVAVNKMDKVHHSADCFAQAANEIRDYLRRIDIAATAIIPISAKHGQMIAERSPALSWYHGPTLLEALDRLEPDAYAPDVLPLRFAVQDVYRFDERRILAGRVESGVLRVGDMLSFAPSGAVAKVASIEDWNQPTRRVTAGAGDSIGITLDHSAVVERGNVAAPAAEPMPLARRIRMRMFWLAADPLFAGRSLILRLAAGEYRVVVRAIEAVIDLRTLERHGADRVLTNEVAEIMIEATDLAPVDRYTALPRTGRAVLISGGDAVGGAIVLDFVEILKIAPSPAATRGVSRAERERRHRHRGAVLWLTGLPGAGKSTLAAALERALFEGGMHAVVLDGDVVRQNLSHDLGFTPEDRSENTRRMAEAAKLLADAGNIAIAALVSPTRADRARARAIVGEGFAEIYIRADPALCEQRDPKGLYARARRGEIRFYTGIDAAYEPPDAPEMIIDTGKLNIADSVDRLVGFVDSRFHDPRIDQRSAEPEWSV
jgi:bifunctional enzyme CysN/CysC